ncbi:hypothetical protein CROQUDRAFT_526007 [Cronartium quercuum f. sp. fusiforme G11]|uniref:Uncharacterized protein n=1 Tax=Cronartium quercuum f. sp. fusiforme G11 TaxID=708437 RepID=A0A9P6NMT6_9BASI|nr:hypothetical protein CROQUDRAFT_526007 [Cronartium quercuum f. sp. fusiforme G11]
MYTFFFVIEHWITRLLFLILLLFDVANKSMNVFLPANFDFIFIDLYIYIYTYFYDVASVIDLREEKN